MRSCTLDKSSVAARRFLVRGSGDIVALEARYPLAVNSGKLDKSARSGH